jgi:ribonucleoside-diphosphate reductase alpha chain
MSASSSVLNKMLEIRPNLATEGKNTVRFMDDNNKFYLNVDTVKYLHSLSPIFGFNGFGETVYYRTYSRLIPGDKSNKKSVDRQEQWADTVVRVINGIFHIRKDHYIKNKLEWDEDYWQKYASEMAVYMFQMKFLPPGRGLWAMGTEFVSERGSSALFNCAFCSTEDILWASHWTMDFLMHGTGVGFNTDWKGNAFKPNKQNSYEYIIPDSREGWCDSIYCLINAYVPDSKNNLNKFPVFNYSRIRPAGLRINGFGGISSGPEPLKILHGRIESYFDKFLDGSVSHTRLIVDLMNAIGACVVAGNVRRSAEIALGRANDDEFLDLKDWNKNPDRADIMWMSNNSIQLWDSKDFDRLPELVERCKINGEPGLLNMINIQKFGRFGRLEKDDAIGINPCGEIPLENGELCNLAEVFPTRCVKDSDQYYKPDPDNTIREVPFNKENFDKEDFYKACEFATFYSSTVSLLPTHRVKTNKVIARNRRIGVSLSGITDLSQVIGNTKLTRTLRDSYTRIKATNIQLAKDAGVPNSVRVTTIKPSGSISQLVGVSSGMHFPPFQYCIRRLRVSKTAPVAQILIDNEIPHETDFTNEKTWVFEFPIKFTSKHRAPDVSIWEQFALLAMIQREYADNSVSCTITYNKDKESSELERALAQYVPVIKSVSILPHSDKGEYPQMPYEGISEEEYNNRISNFPKIDWSKFVGSDGQMARYCTNDSCEIISAA